jgi:hypothetical protein
MRGKVNNSGEGKVEMNGGVLVDATFLITDAKAEADEEGGVDLMTCHLLE